MFGGLTFCLMLAILQANGQTQPVDQQLELKMQQEMLLEQPQLAEKGAHNKYEETALQSPQVLVVRPDILEKLQSLGKINDQILLKNIPIEYIQMLLDSSDLTAKTTTTSTNTAKPQSAVKPDVHTIKPLNLPIPLPPHPVHPSHLGPSHYHPAPIYPPHFPPPPLYHHPQFHAPHFHAPHHYPYAHYPYPAPYYPYPPYHYYHH